LRSASFAARSAGPLASSGSTGGIVQWYCIALHRSVLAASGVAWHAL